MTAVVIDLCRVRSALARLDRVAREHPALTEPAACDRLADWIDTDQEEQEDGPQPVANDVST